MKHVVVLATVLALAIARPEMYKEKEDFQYSRSSSDDGSKSGFYGAQRGNMGGNYERAHNMDSLAQNQMSGLVKQVDGELGDGAKTRAGRVYSSAKSSGTYGSGHYDLSNLAGRNFQEGTSYGDSQSHSSLSQSSYGFNNAGHSSSQHSRYRSGYQAGEHLDSQALQSEGLQSLDNLQAASQYDLGHQSHNSGYSSQSGFQKHSEYDSSNLNSHGESSGLGSNIHTRLVSGTPVRIIVRPGTTIAVPVAAQTYDTSHGSLSSYNHNALTSEAEVLGTSLGSAYKPVNPKQYESSYSYRKEWEKHGRQPATVVVPTNSELYEDRSESANSGYSGYNSNVKSSSSQSRYRSNYNENEHTALSNANSNAYAKSGSDAYVGTLSGSDAYAQNLYGGNARYQGSLSDSNYAYNQAGHNSDLNSQVENLSGKPKNYQSSYSYHKSWERQGDPYVIKPAGIYDSQSQRFTSGTKNMGYASHSHQSEDCDENGHIRVARSYNSDNFYPDQEMQQQSQNLFDDDSGQQVQSSHQKFEDFGQQVQASQNLEDFGQQVQASQNLEDFGQQVQASQKLEDFGQQVQASQNLEDFGQQVQASQNLENFGQQVQASQNLEDFGQQVQASQNLEDFGQQVQASQNLEDFGQQTQTHWDPYDAGQQSLGQRQTNWEKYKDMGQSPINSYNLENIQQQSQNSQNVEQQSQNQHELIQQDTIQHFEKFDKQTHDDGVQTYEGNIGVFHPQIDTHRIIKNKTADHLTNIWDNFDSHSVSKLTNENDSQVDKSSSSLASIWDKIDSFDHLSQTSNIQDTQHSQIDEQRTVAFNIDSTRSQESSKDYESLTKDDKETNKDIGRGDISPDDSNDNDNDKNDSSVINILGQQNTQNRTKQYSYNNNQHVSMEHKNIEDYSQHQNVGPQMPRYFGRSVNVEKDKIENHYQRHQILQNVATQENLDQQNLKKIGQEETQNEHNWPNFFSKHENLDQQSMQDFGSQQTQTEYNLDDFAQHENFDQQNIPVIRPEETQNEQHLYDFAQRENLDQQTMQDFVSHQTQNKYNLQQFSQHENVDQQNMQENGLQKTQKELNLHDFGQHENIDQQNMQVTRSQETHLHSDLHDFRQHENFDQQNMQDFGVQETQNLQDFGVQETQNLQDFGVQETQNLQDFGHLVQKNSKPDNTDLHAFAQIGAQDSKNQMDTSLNKNIEQQNLAQNETDNQKNLNQNQQSFENLQLNQNFDQLSLQAFTPLENLGQKNVGRYENNHNNQEQHNLHGIEQLETMGQVNLPHFGQNESQYEQNLDEFANENLSQQSYREFNPVENFEQQNTQNAYMDNQEKFVPQTLQQPRNSEQVSESLIPPKVNKENNVMEPKVEVVLPIEPVTETPGFWKSVGSKFSSAKDKVASWFKS